MPNNQESKELDAQKGDLGDKLRECPFCGEDVCEIDTSIPDSFHITCDCGADYLGLTLEELMEGWNTRAPSKQLTTTQQALDIAVAALKEIERTIPIETPDKLGLPLAKICK